MSRILISIFLCILNVQIAFGQDSKSVAIAYYKLTHDSDTSGTFPPLEEVYMSIIGKNSYVYQSYDRMVADSMIKENFEKTGTVVPPSRVYDQTIHYFFLDQGKSYLQRRLVKKYTLEQPLPKIDWKIVDEFKMIDQLNCQKAEGAFGGRYYTVWFCPEIPVSAGPWKLNGLPGLILSASDQTGRIRFDFLRFESNSQTTIALDEKAPIVTWKDFRAMADSYNQDPDLYFRRQMGISSPGNRRGPSKRDVLAKPSYHTFPLEAEEIFL